MNHEQIVEQLSIGARLVPARDAEREVPDHPGLYSIFVDRPESLPPPFDQALIRRRTKLIYVGKTEKTLNVRLASQDLQGEKGHATFFRSIGAVLCFQPSAGSLSPTGRNYTFPPKAKRHISRWLRDYVSVRWVKLPEGDIVSTEKRVIGELRPLLNISDNPEPHPRLKQLRKECLATARRLRGEAPR